MIEEQIVHTQVHVKIRITLGLMELSIGTLYLLSL